MTEQEKEKRIDELRGLMAAKDRELSTLKKEFYTLLGWSTNDDFDSWFDDGMK